MYTRIWGKTLLEIHRFLVPKKLSKFIEFL
jgi:hypothetical protein